MKMNGKQQNRYNVQSIFANDKLTYTKGFPPYMVNCTPNKVNEQSQNKIAVLTCWLIC